MVQQAPQPASWESGRDTLPPCPPAKSAVMEQLRKTQFCRYFKGSGCRYGSRCNFAHVPADLQPRPNLFKTKLCARHLNGTCLRGADCTFAHGHDELRATQSIYKSAMCSDWVRRRVCPLGDRCRRAHGLEELLLARVTRGDAGGPPELGGGAGDGSDEAHFLSPLGQHNFAGGAGAEVPESFCNGWEELMAHAREWDLSANVACPEDGAGLCAALPLLGSEEPGSLNGIIRDLERLVDEEPANSERSAARQAAPEALMASYAAAGDAGWTGFLLSSASLLHAAGSEDVQHWGAEDAAFRGVYPYPRCGPFSGYVFGGEDTGRSSGLYS